MSSGFTPTAEQQTIMEAAGRGDTMVVTAGAGTGKTCTMRLAGEQIGGKGLYLAFNRAIAEEAKGSFPSHIDCRTAHSLAFQAVGKRYRQRLSGARQPAREVAHLLGIKQPLEVAKDLSLPPGLQARLVRDGVRNFCRGVDEQPQWWHMPRLDGMDEHTETQVRQTLAPYARVMWEDLQRDDAAGGGKFRFEHDHYLHMWGKMLPKLPYDFVLFDEAQDADRVISRVVQAQDAQTILVGDSSQAIYEWRGSRDVLASWPAHTRLQLSESFRFGPAVADEANKWLKLLDADMRITGRGPESTVGPIIGWPDAVLCRTNATAAVEAMGALEDGKRVALVGGAEHIINLAKACKDMRSGRGTAHPELIAFRDWQEVQQYVSEDAEGSDLRAFVKLVDQQDPDVVIDAMRQLKPEQQQPWMKHRFVPPDVVVSTAHKAKGREWGRVRIASDFEEPTDDEAGNPGPVPRADAMLAYVSVTRAQGQLEPGGLSWINQRPELDQNTERSSCSTTGHQAPRTVSS